MASYYKINLGYNPNVTLDFIESVVKENFPECKIDHHWGIPRNYVFIRQSNYVQANVVVIQKKTQNKTVVRITMGIKPSTQYWLGLIAFVIHYNRRGDFGEQVEDALRDGLRDKLGVKW